MKICIFGAGAVGGFIGTLLARADVDVTLITRGEHLDAIQRHGTCVLEGDEKIRAYPTATDDPGAAGPQDYVIVTAKAYAISEIAEQITPLLGPDTSVVMAQNGIPWWYFHGADGEFAGRRLESVDPGGKAWALIGPGRAIGCVVFASNEVVEPGVIRHFGNQTLVVGEPDGADSDRCKRLAAVLAASGFESYVEARIRDAVWRKLTMNVSLSLLCALTGSTLGALIADPASLKLVKQVMDEAKQVGERLGVRFATATDDAIAHTGRVGAHKPSILIDLERGRRIELEAQGGAVVELACLAGVPTPTIDMVYALLRRRAIAAGCFPDT